LVCSLYTCLVIKKLYTLWDCSVGVFYNCLYCPVMKTVLTFAQKGTERTETA
jgi:hypothetical protein